MAGFYGETVIGRNPRGETLHRLPAREGDERGGQGGWLESHRRHRRRRRYVLRFPRNFRFHAGLSTAKCYSPIIDVSVARYRRVSRSSRDISVPSGNLYLRTTISAPAYREFPAVLARAYPSRIYVQQIAVTFAGPCTIADRCSHR